MNAKYETVEHTIDDMDEFQNKKSGAGLRSASRVVKMSVFHEILEIQIFDRKSISGHLEAVFGAQVPTRRRPNKRI